MKKMKKTNLKNTKQKTHKKNKIKKERKNDKKQEEKKHQENQKNKKSRKSRKSRTSTKQNEIEEGFLSRTESSMTFLFYYLAFQNEALMTSRCVQFNFGDRREANSRIRECPRVTEKEVTMVSFCRGAK